jgi:hypothetical protein
MLINWLNTAGEKEDWCKNDFCVLALNGQQKKHKIANKRHV